jgi:hypothetical protein
VAEALAGQWCSTLRDSTGAARSAALAGLLAPAWQASDSFNSLTAQQAAAQPDVLVPPTKCEVYSVDAKAANGVITAFYNDMILEVAVASSPGCYQVVSRAAFGSSVVSETPANAGNATGGANLALAESLVSKYYAALNETDPAAKSAALDALLHPAFKLHSQREFADKEKYVNGGAPELSGSSAKTYGFVVTQTETESLELLVAKYRSDAFTATGDPSVSRTVIGGLNSMQLTTFVRAKSGGEWKMLAHADYGLMTIEDMFPHLRGPDAAVATTPGALLVAAVLAVLAPLYIGGSGCGSLLYNFYPFSLSE